MITVSKEVLNANLSEYFRRVEEEGEEVIVTTNHVPVFKVVPLNQRLTVDEAFGDLRGKVRIDDNIMQADTDEWGNV